LEVHVIKMATEIELKAHVANHLEIGNRLPELAVFTGTFEKKDVFYSTAGSTAYGVRLRKESKRLPSGTSTQKNLVTWKSKQVADGIEINDEKEFEVSSCEVFEQFLTHLGFMEKSGKQKKGSSYDNNGMTVELTEVEGLGWFVELEMISDDEDAGNTQEETFTAARKKLLDFLAKLGIERNAIESRSYTEMLRGMDPAASGLDDPNP
jgi:adenylate cyclase class 2